MGIKTTYNKKEFDRICTSKEMQKFVLNETRKLRAIDISKPIQSYNEKFADAKVYVKSHTVIGMKPRLFNEENREAYYEWLKSAGTTKERAIAHMMGYK